MNAKRPILILTSAFGEGHNAAAKNLALALRLQDPERHVEVRDLFAEAYGPLYKVAQKGYFLFINHLPSLWGAFYRYLDKDKGAPGRISIHKRAARLLAKTVGGMRPAVIASTYPGYNHLLDHLHGKVDRPYRTVTVVTDSISINSLWYSGHSDLYLVPNEVTARVMEVAGVPRAKLVATGFPVPPLFETLRGRRASPGPMVRPKVLFLVNPGQKNAGEIFRHLGSVDGIDLAAACGRDEKLRHSLQGIADTFTPPHPRRWMDGGSSGTPRLQPPRRRQGGGSHRAGVSCRRHAAGHESGDPRTGGGKCGTPLLDRLRLHGHHPSCRRIGGAACLLTRCRRLENLGSECLEDRKTRRGRGGSQDPASGSRGGCGLNRSTNSENHSERV